MITWVIMCILLLMQGRSCPFFSLGTLPCTGPAGVLFSGSAPSGPCVNPWFLRPSAISGLNRYALLPGRCALLSGSPFPGRDPWMPVLSGGLSGFPAACRSVRPMGLSAALPARETWNQSAAGTVPSFNRRAGSASSVPRDAVPDPFAVRHWHHVLSPITRACVFSVPSR